MESSGPQTRDRRTEYKSMAYSHLPRINMPIPTARVKIELQTLFWVRPAVMTGSDVRYARAQAQVGSGPALMTGRSRPILDAGGTFDLTPEAIPWIFEFDVNPGDSVSIRVHVTKDLGDVGPPAPDVVTASISDPWKSGVTIFGTAPLAVQVKVTTTYINPADAAFVARASAASGVSATLTAPQGFFVQLTDILGLYKPVFPIPAPPRHWRRLTLPVTLAATTRAASSRTAFPTEHGRGTPNSLRFTPRSRPLASLRSPRVVRFNGPSRIPTIQPTTSVTFTENGVLMSTPMIMALPRALHLGVRTPATMLRHSPPGNTDESKLFGHGVSGSASLGHRDWRSRSLPLPHPLRQKAH